MSMTSSSDSVSMTSCVMIFIAAAAIGDNDCKVAVGVARYNYHAYV